MTYEDCELCGQEMKYVHCYGDSRAAGCHESFTTMEAALLHRSKTGGCHSPWSVGLVSTAAVIDNRKPGKPADYSPQWAPWKIREEKKGV